ncbi:CRAL-TRIO lipid binding domain containing protein [Trema orientale]|uniref:CRAL-TRIO lipid binding domain containing protein n=1 Tax=Trema orientale TaxID=63057 RepID=A0A2P5F1W1_TREOI|nr:CRAL-TRIO lipid binding domain containing protein [Trema orientale]
MDLNKKERENDDNLNQSNIKEQVVEMKEERVGEAVAVAMEEEKEEEETVTTEMAEIEKSKVAIMRALVQREDPSSKEVDDLMLRRFLRARNMDIDKASNMFLNYLNWRHSFVPTGSISASQIPHEIAQNKFFMQGVDRNGRPIILVYAGRHKQLKLDDFKRFVVFCLDKICARMPRGQEKFLAIGDLQGWGYANSDVRGYLAALSILQDCYPERLGKLFLVHVPYIFMTAWKMVYPFIDKNTKKKIMFVENKKLNSTLLSDIDESQLPEIYGGKLPLVPIQDC